MTPRDEIAFGQLMTDVLAFWRQDVTTFTLTVWWEACKAFDLEQVRKALTAHAMDPERGQFAPKPADLVRQLQGTHTDRALLAWGKVWDAMQSVGAYQSVDFGDPITHAAIVDIGGWVSLCRIDLNDLPFVQKRFCDAYRVYSTRGKADAPLRLAGDHEIANAKVALPPPVKTVLLGAAPSTPNAPTSPRLQ
jgi:hypothetical protein